MEIKEISFVDEEDKNVVSVYMSLRGSWLCLVCLLAPLKQPEARNPRDRHQQGVRLDDGHHAGGGASTPKSFEGSGAWYVRSCVAAVL